MTTITGSEAIRPFHVNIPEADLADLRQRLAQTRLPDCGSAWKKDPVSGVIGVEKGPLIPLV